RRDDHATFLRTDPLDHVLNRRDEDLFASVRLDDIHVVGASLEDVPDRAQDLTRDRVLHAEADDLVPVELTFRQRARILTRLDDVEVDSGAFARCGGFDEGAESADDTSLSADDFADVLFVDLELVDGGVAVLDFVDFDGVGLVDEGFGDILDKALQIGLEIL